MDKLSSTIKAGDMVTCTRIQEENIWVVDDKVSIPEHVILVKSSMYLYQDIAEQEDFWIVRDCFIDACFTNLNKTFDEHLKEIYN